MIYRRKTFTGVALTVAGACLLSACVPFVHRNDLIGVINETDRSHLVRLNQGGADYVVRVGPNESALAMVAAPGAFVVAELLGPDCDVLGEVKKTAPGSAWVRIDAHGLSGPEATDGADINGSLPEVFKCEREL